MHKMPTTQVEDESPAMKQRRDVLNASIGQIYPNLCRETLAYIVKRRRGMKQQQMEELAEEVVHEAISRALARADRYDPSKRAAPWIMQYVINILKESVRQTHKQKTQTDLGDEAWKKILDACQDGVPPETNEERLSQLDQALAKLTPAQRDILRLRFNEKLDGEQLAEVIGATAGTARTRLSRALQTLRAALEALSNQEEKP